ncbi:MAG: Gfo/Idh/MocA family oxidoreductase [Spirochaetes bacterium]|nr:Gfo/Idh/MocA family oxidoreductase [Spirochaetota bacterium]
MTAKKRYAVCGVSGRGIHMFIGALQKKFREQGEIVAMLDIDARRFEVCCEQFPDMKQIPTFIGEDSFDDMVAKTNPDTVIVTSMDRTHVIYILKALAKNLNVICEKPMVTTSEDCRRVLEAEKQSKGRVTVTFNYRYAAHCRKVKELILEGKVGRITSVDLNWYIDTYHGASYFKRWNRMRENSGGLSIHKSTHHFDLVSWWLDQKPVEVFAFGALNYFGANGETNPLKGDGRHCGTCAVRNDCAYYMRWAARSATQGPKDDHLGTVKAAYTNYRPDMCIFDSAINIEDTYTAAIKYDKGALFSYSVNFSAPYEGFLAVINGTKGRIELNVNHAVSRTPFPAKEYTLSYMPLFGGARDMIDVLEREGGHGGADPILQEDLFLGPDPKRGYEIMSNANVGAMAVCTGEAVWKSVKEKRSVTIAELLKEFY